MTFHNSDYREIITKAVCGSGQSQGKETNYVKPEHTPTSILGCWVINHTYHAEIGAIDKVEIRGAYDVNIWYSYDDNSKTQVVTETIKYCDEIVLSNRDQHSSNADEVIAKVTQQPHCLQCKIESPDNQIAVEVEKGFIVNVIGETRVNVRVAPEEFQVSAGENINKGKRN